MHELRDADIAMVIACLHTEGWFFPEGRAILVELFGIGAQDGVEILLSRNRASDER